MCVRKAHSMRHFPRPTPPSDVSTLRISARFQSNFRMFRHRKCSYALRVYNNNNAVSYFCQLHFDNRGRAHKESGFCIGCQRPQISLGFSISRLGLSVRRRDGAGFNISVYLRLYCYCRREVLLFSLLLEAGDTRHRRGFSHQQKCSVRGSFCIQKQHFFHYKT